MATKGQIKQTAKGRGRKKKDRSTEVCADVMTPDPVCLIATDSVLDAAQAMREHDVGAVVVLDETTARLRGLVTDRDIVVRVLADELDPSRTTLASVSSEELTVLEPDDSVDEAVILMREHSIRRIPIVEDGKPVGIVSLGDLAVARDPESALADISGAPPNE